MEAFLFPQPISKNDPSTQTNRGWRSFICLPQIKLLFYVCCYWFSDDKAMHSTGVDSNQEILKIVDA